MITLALLCMTMLHLLSYDNTEGETVAVLNIRIDDDYRDRLREKAEDQGVSLSEYVRALVLEDVVDVRRQDELTDTETAPETMTLTERQMLALLHRISARVMPEKGETLDGADGDRDDQLRLAQILEAGYTAEYFQATAGFRTELSHLDCTRVTDILQMFQIIAISAHRLADAADEDLTDRLRFQGFDHQDLLESRMASYVEFLMQDENTWVELRPQIEETDGGNSHHRMLDVYLRMLTEYRRITDARTRKYSPDDYLLSLEDLQRIDRAQIHPSRRQP